MTNLPEMIPLTDADLDAVAGGQVAVAGGLVNVVLNGVNIDVLRNADINVDIIDDITIRNVANNNNVSVGALINVLGGPSAIIQRQTQ
ncbi:MAG: hypothetical protein ACJ8DX_05830 [Xanthobacteraceae bacterium]